MTHPCVTDMEAREEATGQEAANVNFFHLQALKLKGAVKFFW
jgi:hypothetical protein